MATAGRARALSATTGTTRLAALAVGIAAAVIAAATTGVASPPVATAVDEHPMASRQYQPYEDRAGAGRWAVSFGAGMFTSGDLFRVALPEGADPRFWTVPGGGARFYSTEFRVAVDQDVLATMGLAYHLSRRWLVRLDLGWSEVPTTAYARVSQVVDLVRWDRLTFTLAGLGLEARLASTRLYPYLMAGAALVKLSAAGAPALDQTRLAVRGGIGCQYSLDPSWGVRGEIRDTVRQFDMSRYADDPLFSGAEFTANGPQNLFEISLSIRGIL